MRYHDFDSASVVERALARDVFELRHKDMFLTIFDLDRGIDSEELQQDLGASAEALRSNALVESVVYAGCKPGMLGIDYVMRRRVPADDAAPQYKDEDDAR